MKKPKTIRNVGKLFIRRSEQFQLKQVVSDFIEKLIELSAKNAALHILKMKYTTFCYGELQIHSIIVPAITRLTDYCILEYPIRRGINDNNGRVDYYCVNNAGTNNEYHLFLELKCGRQGIPSDNFRKNNIKLWQEANNQLEGITQELSNNKEFYKKPNMRVCMEIITLYADKTKNKHIKSNSDKILNDIINIGIDALESTGIKPNLSALWQFHPNIVKQAEDEFNGSRQFWGLLFLCRIMPPPK
ncbi:uncharacterized membrane protein YcgQ (UPF0703/DUF1980 family) [Dysgonomonas hofstadii]|uniref:Uncharacterized membrane protein YcgQ (UPF0703/DUF1980 family) n=1 Tax=Dysgonomonas hofstadii TaxID=637886 RepID=A0A840CJF9_9BACT|nr:hypothetical protein [Dysgonomonas hofstadii]MBB4034148.1 uncharacterized membrane protein YcgQ (UPF0703/DUF1980 family) [Dysgonomonas hofstadii]